MATKENLLEQQANLGYLLTKASAHWNALLYQRCREAGYPDITPAYGAVMLPLYQEDGLTMGELARRSKLSKQTMTTLVRDMEKRQLISRKRHPVDGRAYQIYLTKRSLHFRHTAREIQKDLHELVEMALSKAQLEDLKTNLRTLMMLDNGPAKEGGKES
jgi:DNA-binding MarR family transcriptional regulator